MRKRSFDSGFASTQDDRAERQNTLRTRIARRVPQLSWLRVLHSGKGVVGIFHAVPVAVAPSIPMRTAVAPSIPTRGKRATFQALLARRSFVPPNRSAFADQWSALLGATGTAFPCGAGPAVLY